MIVCSKGLFVEHRIPHSHELWYVDLYYNFFQVWRARKKSYNMDSTKIPLLET